MNPVCTSTPNPGLKKVSGRRSIHEKIDYPSPVQPEGQKKDKKTQQNNVKADKNINRKKMKNMTNEEENDETIEEEVRKESREIKETKNLLNKKPKNVKKDINLINYWCENYQNYLSNFIYVSIIIIALMIPSYNVKRNLKGDEAVMNVSISNMKAAFQNQPNEFWHYITSNIKEVQRLNKPSIILFLYLENYEKKSNDLIINISKLASRILNENSYVEPIILDGSKLNTVQYLRDYGILIDDYRHILENRHVMLVKNLENVQASISQAFHAICDEYTPLVRKSFITFSVKVPRFVGKEMEQAGEILRKTWEDLEGDKLEPLIARVTNLVLKINPEL